MAGLPVSEVAGLDALVAVRTLGADEPWPAELQWPVLVTTPDALAARRAHAPGDLERCLPVVVGPQGSADRSVLRAALDGALAARAGVVAAEAGFVASEADLETFVHAVGHDLKGPIQGILGLAGLLTERPGAVAEEMLPFARRIETDAQRLAQMIDALTAQSRLGRGGVRWQAVDVEQLVEEVFARAIGEFGDRVPRLVCDRPIPRLRADAALLEVLLGALVDNGLRYNDRTPPRVRVSFEAGALTVRDDGIGIPERAREAIFEMFTRIDRKRPGGCGAGLALAARAAELMGTRVAVTSEVGLGSAFRVPLEVAG